MVRINEIRRYPIVIAVAGMDAALASVLGDQVPGAMICVPISMGYDTAEKRGAPCSIPCWPVVHPA